MKAAAIPPILLFIIWSAQASPPRLDNVEMSTTNNVSQTHRQTLCGIPLRPGLANVLNEINRKSAKQVTCEIATLPNVGAVVNRRAGSGICADGTPFIVLDSQRGLTEIEIAHELFHLKQIADGFPHAFLTTPPRSVDKRVANDATKLVYDILLHRLFFPKMRALGLDQTTDERRRLDELVNRPDRRDELHAILLHLDNSTYSNPEPASVLDAWFVSNGQGSAAQKAERIEKSIQKNNPRTPEQIQPALVEALSVIFASEFSPSDFTPSFGRYPCPGHLNPQ